MTQYKENTVINPKIKEIKESSVQIFLMSEPGDYRLSITINIFLLSLSLIFKIPIVIDSR
jgi:hypothetical protein